MLLTANKNKANKYYLLYRPKVWISYCI